MSCIFSQCVRCLGLPQILRVRTENVLPTLIMLEVGYWLFGVMFISAKFLELQELSCLVVLWPLQIFVVYRIGACSWRQGCSTLLWYTVLMM